MRVMALLATSLVVFGAFAGCVGGTPKDDEPIGSTSTTGSGTTPGATTTQPPQLNVRAPLTTSLTLDAPAWIQSGTQVPVKLATPTNGKGALTYGWASGPLVGTVKVADEVMPDTKVIAPGATGALTYAKAGVYTMHCHPHPFMLHNVTVIDGYVGPSAVDVYITDGAAENTYRFVPENVVVGPNTTITYRNVGSLPHTATAMATQSPPLKALPLTTESGSLKLEGNGWINVVAFIQDSEGRLGLVNKSIYVTPTLPAFAAQSLDFEFTHGLAPLAGTAAEGAPKTAAVTLAHPGAVTINYTFADAVASQNAAAPNNAQVEIHFTKDGETQDTLTSEPTADGSLTGKAIAGAYTLTVIPVQGADISGTVTIEVVYDLVPPSPAMAGAPADESHGEHAH